MGETSRAEMTKGTSMTTPADISFTSGRGEIDEKTVAWKIDNFAEFLEMSDNELQGKGIVFDAGKCLLQNGTWTKATWNFFFRCKTNSRDENWIGGSLYLQNDMTKKVQSAKAWCSLTFSSGGKAIDFIQLSERKEFSTKGNVTWGWSKLFTKADILEKTREKDALEITINVTVISHYDFKPVVGEVTPPSPEEMELGEEVNLDLGKLLESQHGFNVNIRVPMEDGVDVTVSSYTRKAHRLILAARSPVFLAMFDRDMIETRTGEMVIEDMSPKGLDVFLHYLYTGKMLPDWIQVLPEILNAADKYQCGKLKHFCGHHLISAVTTANALKMYKLAKLHNLSFAMKGITEFISKNTKGFIDVIEKVVQV